MFEQIMSENWALKVAIAVIFLMVGFGGLLILAYLYGGLIFWVYIFILKISGRKTFAQITSTTLSTCIGVVIGYVIGSMVAIMTNSTFDSDYSNASILIGSLIGLAGGLKMVEELKDD